MELYLATRLPAPPEVVWQHVQTTRLLRHITFPVLEFEPLDPPALPEQWEERPYLVRLKLFGALPFGRQWLDLSVLHIETTPARQRYVIRDNGRGDFISTWDHHITIEEDAGAQTLYSDRVRIEAGWLTLPIWLYASLFYRYRQWRWRKLAASRFARIMG